MSEELPRGRYSSIVGMDPRAEWLLGPGFRYFQPAGPEALIVFSLESDPDLVERLQTPLPGQRGPAVILLSARRDRAGRHVVLAAPRTFFDRVANRDPDNPLGYFRTAPKRIQFSLPLPDRCFPPLEADGTFPEIVDPDIGPPPGGWPPKTVVLGVVDDGIAFAHERFLKPDDTTRIECFWQQDGTPPPTPPTVPHGREILKAEIDAGLTANRQAGIVDEDEIYRQTGLIDFGLPEHKPAAWRLAHGTHVLDLAANGPPQPVPGPRPENRPIICVQLPVAVTAAQAGAGLESFVESAIDYILHRAQLLSGSGPPLPVGINFSYGIAASSHDGTSPTEAKIDGVVNTAPAAAPVRVVLPAGNSHLARGHAQVRLEGTGPGVRLPLRLQPDDQTPSLVQIWMPHVGAAPPAPSRLSLTVTGPDGAASVPLTETPGALLPLMVGGAEVGLANYEFATTPTERGVFNIYFHPTTQSLDIPPHPLAPHGLWTLTLQGTGPGPGGPVHAWIERDDLLYGYPRRGRQAFFDHPDYLRFDDVGEEVTRDAAQPPQCPVLRAGMINGIATGAASIVVGGFQRRELEYAAYSAGGPITPAAGGVIGPLFRKPDAGLVCDESRVHAGVLAAGSRSGSTVAMGGTSVAAPQRSWAVLDELAAGGAGDRVALLLLAIAAETTLPAWAPPLDILRGGWGRLGWQEPIPEWRRRYW